jgi:hypothetical protein
MRSDHRPGCLADGGARCGSRCAGSVPVLAAHHLVRLPSRAGVRHAAVRCHVAVAASGRALLWLGGRPCRIRGTRRLQRRDSATQRGDAGPVRLRGRFREPISARPVGRRRHRRPLWRGRPRSQPPEAPSAGCDGPGNRLRPCPDVRGHDDSLRPAAASGERYDRRTFRAFRRAAWSVAGAIWHCSHAVAAAGRHAARPGGDGLDGDRSGAVCASTAQPWGTPRSGVGRRWHGQRPGVFGRRSVAHPPGAGAAAFGGAFGAGIRGPASPIRGALEAGPRCQRGRRTEREWRGRDLRRGQSYHSPGIVVGAQRGSVGRGRAERRRRPSRLRGSMVGSRHHWRAAARAQRAGSDLPGIPTLRRGGRRADLFLEPGTGARYRHLVPDLCPVARCRTVYAHGRTGTVARVRRFTARQRVVSRPTAETLGLDVVRDAAVSARAPG